MTATLATPAWILAGRLRNLPGVLVTDGTRLEFRTGSDAGSESGSELVFGAPLTEVGPVSWPWWWFGGGFVATVAGERYKVTFVRPNGAPPVEPALLDTALVLGGLIDPGHGPAQAARGLLDVRSGRAAGRAWREVLPTG
jgi:hypothetical protein